LASVVALCVLAKPAALLAIEGYQRYVSPHKGFHCAHGKLHGGLTCSAFGKKAIAENGLMAGAILLRGRFRQCHQAAVTLSAQRCDPGPRAGDCGESAGERGERETKEYKEYCCGSCQGCCGK
jgi:putative component of membrane protein insertase Oxa1/YidC/SpoIIIJ protein YidD